jgi:hypothetical protein
MRREIQGGIKKAGMSQGIHRPSLRREKKKKYKKSVNLSCQGLDKD